MDHGSHGHQIARCHLDVGGVGMSGRSPGTYAAPGYGFLYCWYKGITRELGTPQLYSLTNSAVGGTTSGTGLPTSALYQPLCQLLFRPLKKYRFSVAR